MARAFGDAARRPLRNAWFAARIPISRSTLLARGLSWRPFGTRDHRIRRRTVALIDGFPRSGNTTAVYAFWRGNPEAMLAHHLHSAAEVKRAVRRSIPTVILVREPAAAIASLILYQGAVMHPRLGVRTYVAFHRDTLPLAAGFAVCTFDQLMEDVGRPVALLNQRFGTDFLERPLDGDDKEEIRQAIAHTQHLRGDPERKWSVPTEERRAAKERVLDAVKAAPGFEEALDLYASFVEFGQANDKR